MKLIIDIPEEIYKASKIIDVQYEDVVQIPFEVIANGTPIPDNSTNRDVISREAVRKILTKYHLGESMIAEELNELPSVTQKSGKWIPVSERLPKVNQRVLVTSYGRVCYAMMISADGNSGHPVFKLQDSLNERVVCETTVHNVFTTGRITAWMPIPQQPYKAEGSEEE